MRRFVVLAVVAMLGLTGSAAIGAATVVVEWNETALAAVRENAPRPTVVSRSLFLVSAAMYDAWAAYDLLALAAVPGNRGLRRPPHEHNEANRRIAVSYAAHHVLGHEWPSSLSRFDETLDALGIAGLPVQINGSPQSVGRIAAQNVLAARSEDGSNAAANFADALSSTFVILYRAVNAADPDAPNAPGNVQFESNHWQPLRVPTGTHVDASGLPSIDPSDPSSYRDQTFLTPHWGSVRPFAISSAAALLAPAPPRRGSAAQYVDALGQAMSEDEAWNRQFDEVLAISAHLDDEQKTIAEFWADGPRSETPPGHWNQLAQGISFRDAHDIGADARMFFALNAALMDAGIATWYTKRAYDFIRPVSAIRHKYAGQTIMAWGGPDLGTQTVPGETWRPYQDLTFVTPPFAEFTSGHSAFSAAAAEVLTQFTGSPMFFDGVTRIPQDLNGDGEHDFFGEHIQLPGTFMFESGPAEAVVLRWPTFDAAADEAGVSRLYGGIHIQDGDYRGRTIGRSAGSAVMTKANALFAGQLPVQVAHSGTWFNPDRNGEGVFLQVLDDGRVLLNWSTYDNGRRQMWLFGAGDAGFDGTIVIPLSVTDGARFGSQFVASDVDKRHWGEARLRFASCNTMTLEYEAAQPGFGAGTLHFTLLAGVAEGRCVDF